MNNRPHLDGATLRLKHLIAVREFRTGRRVFNGIAGLVPYRLKYAIGQMLRRRRHPYCLIREGDVVVQVGAPRDLVRSGRSRAVHFARLVGRGLVVVLEPDPRSAEALEMFARRHGLADRLAVHRLGAWSKPGELGFLSSDEHPASNLLEEFDNILSEQDFRARSYRRSVIPVDTVDNILSKATRQTPRLVSLTTNGAERQILCGMHAVIAAGCPYISLAVAGEGYVEHMRDLGYELVAYDDRGFTFKRTGQLRPPR